MALVYIARNRINDKCYIGKTSSTLKKRIKGHLDKTRSGSKTYFHNAVRKWGLDNFQWEVLEECSDALVDSIEKAWIGLYRAMGKVLYNLTDGGEGTIGHKWPEERKLAQSINRKGHVVTTEARVKIGAANKGRHNTNRAKTWDITLVSPQNVIYDSITNLAAFARVHNLCEQNLHKLIKLQIKTHRGWTLAELDEDSHE